MADIYKMDTDYLSAESVYDRTLGKKQSEINAIAPFVCQQILNENSIPSTARSYACQWSQYDMLIVCSTFYGNIDVTIIVPYSGFVTTSAGQRLILYDAQRTSTYEIYKNGNNAVYLSSTNPDEKFYIRIYGLKFN